MIELRDVYLEFLGGKWLTNFTFLRSFKLESAGKLSIAVRCLVGTVVDCACIHD
jgi:hypothetical protein